MLRQYGEEPHASALPAPFVAAERRGELVRYGRSRRRRHPRRRPQRRAIILPRGRSRRLRIAVNGELGDPRAISPRCLSLASTRRSPRGAGLSFAGRPTRQTSVPLVGPLLLLSTLDARLSLRLVSEGYVAHVAPASAQRSGSGTQSACAQRPLARGREVGGMKIRRWTLARPSRAAVAWVAALTGAGALQVWLHLAGHRDRLSAECAAQAHRAAAAERASSRSSSPR